MQRWLASQAKYPKVLVVVAAVMIALGIWGLASSKHFADHPVTTVTAIPLGIYLMACAIAGLREQRSAARD